MIFYFPDLDTLRLAITSGVVPPAVSLAPAVAGFDEHGHLWLQPSVAPERKVQTALRRLGVQVVNANGALQAEEVCCWLQLLPIRRDPAAPVLTSQTAVLFELSDAGQLPTLVSEVLRLGNDRQSFRYLQDGRQTRVLLRIVGPPYYSLLRALDRDGQEAAPRAYVERAPRVWVEIGHTHPLVEQIRPGAGKLVLMRAPRAWTFLDDTPFRDIYDVLEFALPQDPGKWNEAALEKRLTVPLQLAPGGHTEAAELWVLREEAIDELDRLVRDADDQLLARLAFAVGERDGRRTIVLRVRPSRQAPPVLVLPAQGFRPFLKLPNLFLPCGTRLQPPLRRDAVRKLLADDPARITWLYPQGDGSFVPEELPDEAFRPLGDWVDYVLDRDREVLQAWVQAAQFDFEPFICKDDQPAKPRTPSAKEPRSRPGPTPETVELPPPAAPDIKVVKKSKVKETDPEEFAVLPKAPPSELQLRLSELEKRFLSLEGPLHAAERLALWPEMAALHTALHHTTDAAVCWMNALWELPEPPRDWTAVWARAEANLSGREITTADLDRLLTIGSPTQADLRGLLACVVWGAHSKPPAPALVQRLAKVRHFLEEQETLLPVRGVWLAWVSLIHLSAGDVLGLARVRDRLLERLLDPGLRPEQDLPSFLRFSGQQSSERSRSVRERVQQIHEAAQLWITPGSSGGETAANHTLAYADLMFAFGLARLGEADECRKLLTLAGEVLGGGDDVHQFLLEAYTYRVQQVLQGNPHGGLLPPDLLEHLEILGWPGRYPVDRLRNLSRILEPQEKPDPYRQIKRRGDDLNAELVLLPDIVQREELAARIQQLLGDRRSRFQTPEARVRILGEALHVAPRLGEASSVELLAQALQALDPLPEPLGLLVEPVAHLVDRGLFLAAHYDQPEAVQQLLPWFLRIFQTARTQGAATLIDLVAGQCFRGLRKLGLRDEIDRLLGEMAREVLQGKSLDTLRRSASANWSVVLRSLLHIAGGWLYFGRLEEALPVLDEVRNLLFTEQLPHYERTPLVCLYAATLGQAPVEMALQRIEELFLKLGPITDVYTTNKYFGRSQLEIVESVVLAVMSDDFTVGSMARRWLDEDEYLVRRRIHRDLRVLMAQAGL